MVQAQFPDCRVPRIRNRRGRCYELAFKGVIQAPQWQLVHGYFDCQRVRLGHAWLLHQGKIFCPTLDRVFDEAAYYAEHQTVPLVTYTVHQAAKLVIEHKHYGPWEHEGSLLVSEDRW